MEESPLLEATRLQKTVKALKLIRRGECLDKQSSNGESALIIITKDISVHIKGSEARKIFTDLILYGADPNLRDVKGRTALMYATLSLSMVLRSNSLFSDFYALETLVLNGADVGIVDSKGNTVFQIAQTTGDGRCYEVLMNIVRGTDHMLDLLKSGRAETALTHVASCKDVNMSDGDGNTLLLLAIQNTFINRQRDSALLTKLCEKLVLFGANVNAQNKNGVTPLMMLIMKNFPFDVTKILQLFIDDGANLLIADNRGSTALTYALQHGYIASGANRIVKWLLENGADPMIKIEHRRALACFITGLVDMDIYDSPSEIEVTCKEINQIIRLGEDELLRFVVLNGAIGVKSISVSNVRAKVAVSDRFSDNMDTLSPFLFALVKNRVDLAKYLFAICFLTALDVNLKPGHPLEYILPPESAVLLRDIHSQPWPLVKLAFVAVSTSLGSFPERKVKIDSIELPRSIKDLLNFKDCIAFACQHQWLDIPIYTRDYDRMNAGRPYLFYWPFGYWYTENSILFPCNTCLARNRSLRERFRSKKL